MRGLGASGRREGRKRAQLLSPDGLRADGPGELQRLAMRHLRPLRPWLGPQEHLRHLRWAQPEVRPDAQLVKLNCGPHCGHRDGDCVLGVLTTGCLQRPGEGDDLVDVGVLAKCELDGARVDELAVTSSDKITACEELGARPIPRQPSAGQSARHATRQPSTKVAKAALAWGHVAHLKVHVTHLDEGADDQIALGHAQRLELGARERVLLRERLGQLGAVQLAPIDRPLAAHVGPLQAEPMYKGGHLGGRAVGLGGVLGLVAAEEVEEEPTVDGEERARGVHLPTLEVV